MKEEELQRLLKYKGYKVKFIGKQDSWGDIMYWIIKKKKDKWYCGYKTVEIKDSIYGRRDARFTLLDDAKRRLINNPLDKTKIYEKEIVL